MIGVKIRTEEKTDPTRYPYYDELNERQSFYEFGGDETEHGHPMRFFFSGKSKYVHTQDTDGRWYQTDFEEVMGAKRCSDLEPCNSGQLYP